MDLYGSVPEKIKEFRSVEYWDKFFANLNGEPSEWFSDWEQLQPLLTELCQGKKVLIAGSGTSQLSAQMYDSGVEDITNIDFSKLAIRQQLTQNLRERPKMKWQVMDITKMGFGAGEFDAVVDKGALDTLLSDDTHEGEAAATRYLQEVHRVVAPNGGLFVVNTLAQSPVMRLIMGGMAFGWDCTFHKVPPPAAHATDLLQPLLIVLKKNGNDKLGDVSTAFGVQGDEPNHVQLAHVMDMVSMALAERRHMRQAEEQDCIGFHPGRRMYAELPRPSCQHHHAPGDSCGGHHHHHHHDKPRYHAIVLDATPEVARHAKHECAVFIVPQGREHEYTFSTPQGQWQLLHRCSTSRLIIIVLERGINYHTYHVVRNELQPMVVDLAPLACRQRPDNIVFMSTPEGIGRRCELSEVGSSVREGTLVVEDVKLKGGLNGEEQVLRRLVLLSHRAVILSEQLQLSVADAAKSKTSPAAKPKSSKKASKAIKKADKEGSNGPIPSGGPRNDQLVSSSHKATVAGLVRLLGMHIDGTTNGASTRFTSVVVGGGGCVLPTYLSTCLAATVQVAEEDEAVAKLAKQFFGYHDGPELQLQIEDGVKVVAELASSSMRRDAIIVDAVTVEPTGAIQCPPLPFIATDFLSHAKQVVGERGVVVLNTAAQPEEHYLKVVQALKDCFSSVYLLPAEDDGSKVLFGTELDLPDTSALPFHTSLAKFASPKLSDAAALSELYNAMAPVAEVTT